MKEQFRLVLGTYYISIRKASEKFNIEKDTDYKLIPTDKSLGPDY